METGKHSLAIIKTGDGSCTLLNNTLEETYHSVNGAMTESMHVFITNGLLKQDIVRGEIHILEVGLGTGLNALLTLDHIPSDTTLYYTAVEPYPISHHLAMEYFNQFETSPKHTYLLQQIIGTSNADFHMITDNVYFRCFHNPIQQLTRSGCDGAYLNLNRTFPGFDIIYYDAFAPNKQPDMWELETLKTATDLMAENGLLISYCAQGQFKRHLKALGLKVESPPGPPGKREMTSARK